MRRAGTAAFILISVIVAFTTMAYGTVHQPLIVVAYLLAALLAACIIAESVPLGKLSLHRSTLQLPLFGAALFGLVQIIPFGTFPTTGGIEGVRRTISMDVFATETNAIHFAVLGIFFACCLISFNSASRLRRMAAIIMIFGFAYAFFAILQSLLSPDKIYGVYERLGIDPFGSFVSRNNYAAWINLAMSVPIGMLFSGMVAKDKRLLYLTAIAIMGISLLLSGSRGGLAGFVTAVLVMLVLVIRGNDSKAIALKAVIAVGLLATVLAGAVLMGGDTTLSRIGNAGTTDGLDMSRLQIWSTTLQMIKTGFPFGIGLGAYGIAFTRLDPNSGLYRVEQAHNDYLQSVSDAGVVGALLLAGFAVCIFFAIRRALSVHNKFRRGLAVGTTGGIASIAVESIFDFPLHTTAIAILFLVITALLVAVSRKYDDDDEDANKPAYRRTRRPAA